MEFVEEAVLLPVHDVSAPDLATFEERESTPIEVADFEVVTVVEDEPAAEAASDVLTSAGLVRETMAGSSLGPVVQFSPLGELDPAGP